ncbi:uncharacterized protein LOC130744644 [Lotus japonicus]|uniref:uncharacterized protein LOC130744644 n=1 Tax=Lotus japonicus TaxID=34305 RepID=UPI00258C5DFA|nr:uncharacterized protein LOC130744644 [Lotus japonicus]
MEENGNSGGIYRRGMQQHRAFFTKVEGELKDNQYNISFTISWNLYKYTMMQLISLQITMEFVEKLDIKLNTLDDVLVKLNILEEAVSCMGIQNCGDLTTRRTEGSGTVRRATSSKTQARGRGRGLGQRLPKTIIQDHDTVIMVPIDDDPSFSSPSQRQSNVSSRKMKAPLTSSHVGSAHIPLQPNKPMNTFNPSLAGRMGKLSGGTSSTPSSHGLVRRFSLKQNPLKRAIKMQKTTAGSSETCELRSNTADSSHTPPVVRLRSSEAASTTIHGLTMPAYIKCKFRPTVEMELSAKKIQLCAYVWHVGDEERYYALCYYKFLPYS